MDNNDYLNEFLGPNPVIVDLSAGNRWEAIDELIGHLVVNHKIKTEHKDAITAAVKKRELSMSTGIGFGIGIPHASTDRISDIIAALGRSRSGIQFDSLDGQSVNLVLLFLVPQDQFQKHLHILAGLVKVLQKRDF